MRPSGARHDAPGGRARWQNEKGLKQFCLVEISCLIRRLSRPMMDGVVSNFPFQDPVTRRELDRQGLEDLLREFEDSWAEHTGERLTSAAFFDRYLADDITDSLFTMAWSSYYDIFRRLRSDPADAETVDTLRTAC